MTSRTDSTRATRQTRGHPSSRPSAATTVRGGCWGWSCRGASHPLARTLHAGWAASPAERLAALLRARNVPIGLVTDGRWWAVVSAPRGKPVGVAVWDASLWSEEPETLAAFVALLERRRFLGVTAADRLPAMLARSAEAQEDVTTALGGQVRTAVEMLVRRFDSLDRTVNGRLLRDVGNDDLYAGIVTVMMRVVFLLFAEERRLLPSDDDAYDHGYSVGRLVAQLRQRASLNGEQTLEHLTGAWHRLLALTRALHAGVHHQDLRLPAYGGALFDPARYPWLESQEATTPPVDDLTVLQMLEAVQFVRIGGESRRLSFRTLDVEQIGYVYEGLLELEVRTATEPVLFLRRPPGVVDFVFESHALEVLVDLPEWTASTYLGKKKATAATRKRADRLLALDASAPSSTVLSSPLERRLSEELAVMAPLFRRDDGGRPAITPPGGRYVAPSSRRIAAGAYYTPRPLAEEIVQHTLEPLVYRPGPLQTLDRTQWVLRPSAEIERLRVADIAMGSGAFLVAACRFLADRWVERLVESTPARYQALVLVWDRKRAGLARSPGRGTCRAGLWLRRSSATAASRHWRSPKTALRTVAGERPEFSSWVTQRRMFPFVILFRGTRPKWGRTCFRMTPSSRAHVVARRS